VRMANKNLSAAVIVCAVMALSVYAPAVVSEHSDKLFFGKLHTKKIEHSRSGYHYNLSHWERLFIFSNARENLAAKGRYVASSLKMEILRIERRTAPAISAYALFANEKGAGNNELSREDATKACWEEITKLKSLGVLPDFPINEKISAWDAKLYSIMNIAEANKNISVWEIYRVPEGKADNDLELQFELDAQTKKVYSFNVPVKQSFAWNELDFEKIMKNYCDYLEAGQAEEYTKGDMTERTPYFKKYTFKKQHESKEEIFITMGFNPGSNSFFLRIP